MAAPTNIELLERKLRDGTLSTKDLALLVKSIKDISTNGNGGSSSFSAINPQPDSYELVSSDIGKVVDMTKATPSDLTVSSSLNASPGDVITVKRSHASGAVTFIQGADVTIIPSSGSLVDAG